MKRLILAALAATTLLIATPASAQMGPRYIGPPRDHYDQRYDDRRDDRDVYIHRRVVHQGTTYQPVCRDGRTGQVVPPQYCGGPPPPRYEDYRGYGGGYGGYAGYPEANYGRSAPVCRNNRTGEVVSPDHCGAPPPGYYEGGGYRGERHGGGGFLWDLILVGIGYAIGSNN